MKLFLKTLILTLLYSGQAYALQPTDYVEPATPSTIFITAVQASEALDYLELYNAGSVPADMSQWSVVFSNNFNEECEIPLQSWLLSKDYGLLSDANVVDAADTNALRYDSASCGMSSGADSYVTEVQLLKDGQPQDTIKMTLADKSSPWVRRGLTATYRTGNFGGATTLPCTALSGKDFAAPSCAGRPQVYTGGWYVPPELHENIKIIEILPNPRNCSPIESTLDCADYVKLDIAGVSKSIVDQYRLRSDSGANGQAASLVNFVPEHQGKYLTVPISLTNSGGWVWLEDEYGTIKYASSVQKYSDASSETKKGLSWAYNSATNSWDWMTPAPDTDNYWPPVNQQSAPIINSNLADCGPGRERNPATNRCRNIVSATNMLTPCKEGQERNPETNRCRSVLGASTTLKPCEPGEVRNPETSRCRKAASATNTLAPCKPGQERNPETNRCRKATGINQLNQVEDVESGNSASTTSWWVTGGIALLALSYIIYEWRQEIFLRLRN